MVKVSRIAMVILIGGLLGFLIDYSRPITILVFLGACGIGGAILSKIDNR